MKSLSIGGNNTRGLLVMESGRTTFRFEQRQCWLAASLGWQLGQVETFEANDCGRQSGDFR
jgi:hypothetical protein